MKKLTKHIAFLAACLLLLAYGETAYASSAYIYNAKEEAIAIVSPYSVQRVISGASLQIGEFNAPKDVFAYENTLYVLDSGNSRIVVLHEDFSLKEQITPSDSAGNPLTFADAMGVCVDKGSVFVADKAAKCVYVLDMNGKETGRLTAPDPALLPPDFDYTPTKVLVNSAGVIHVLSSNTYSGALQFSQDKQFVGFFGSEKVEVTPGLMIDMLWRKILTQKQQEGMKRYVPATFINFDADEKDFIYTVRQTGTEFAQVRCLNPLGINILPEIKFGERETVYDRENKIAISSLIQDVTVDNMGFISIIDSSKGRVFQYDQRSQMLFAFGGRGYTEGSFQMPAAIENIGDRLVVLDESLSNLTVFVPTDFGAAIRQGMKLYNEGKYEECEPYWNTVLKSAGYYGPARSGMGKIYEKQGQYQKAAKEYELAFDSQGYSDAFRQVRDSEIRRFFPVIMISVLLLLLGMVWLSLRVAKHRKSEYNLTAGRFSWPFYCMLHPFRSYDYMKEKKNGSFKVSCIIVGLLFFFRLVYVQGAGLLFEQGELNVPLELFKTVGVFVIWVLCNWAVTTLTDGEGTLKEVWVFSAYALLPYVLALPLLTLLSNLLTLDEGVFFYTASGVVALWTAINLLMAFKEVHRFTVSKTVATTAVSMGAVVISAVLITIVYSMFAQLVGFVSTVVNEVSLR